MTPIFQNKFDEITRDKQEESNIERGTEETRATTISSQLSRLTDKASLRRKAAEEKTISKQRVDEEKQRKADITNAQIQRRPSGEVAGSTETFLRSPAGRRFNNQ
jgi:predicted transcriptional regulator